MMQEQGKKEGNFHTKFRSFFNEQKDLEKYRENICPERTKEKQQDKEYKEALVFNHLAAT